MQVPDEPDLTAELDAAEHVVMGRAETVVTEWGVRRPDLRSGIFSTGSDGNSTYLTTADACNCPSGLRRLTACTCKHSLAVRIRLAA